MSIIGKNTSGENFGIGIHKLLETRLLCQANSGGGKSWLLRKILEESHSQVQQIIIDLEGEFTSLREKYDYLIVGKEGDIDISLKIAKILPRKLLETNVSAILDISELKQHERKLFVKRFLEELLMLPKKFWKPLLIVIDEAHQFNPEKGNAESGPAVIDLMTRGRKRGYCGLLATQRLSKLSKDAAAECNNVLIGRTGLDVDMKRAADVLGFQGKQDMLQLRRLQPGTFFAFGPAFIDGVNEIIIGDVKTQHPRIGTKRFDFTPEPTTKIKKILESFKDIDVEAEKKLHEVEDFKKEIKELRKQLTIKTKLLDKAEQIDKDDIYKKAYQDVLKKQIPKEIVTTTVDKSVLKDLQKISELVHKHINKMSDNSYIKDTTNMELKTMNEMDNIKLRPGAKRMRDVAAQFYPNTVSKARLGFLAKINMSGGTFSTYLGDLKKLQYIEIDGFDIILTKEGLNSIQGELPKLPKGEELLDFWCSKLRPGAERMLRIIHDRYPESVDKEVLGLEADINMNGGTFSTYLGDLKRLKLVNVSGKNIKLHEEFK